MMRVITVSKAIQGSLLGQGVAKIIDESVSQHTVVLSELNCMISVPCSDQP